VDGPRRLPRGRHRLSREQVEQDQRLRILTAFAAAMADDGYVRTPVAAVLRHAGVSRETYYRLYADKLDGFLAALDLVGEVLLAELAAALDGPGEPIERAERALDRYLSLVATHRGEARLFLVEAYAAGPPAIERRAEVQRRIADSFADLLGTRTEDGRLTCRTLVAAVSAMIAGPVVADDPDAVVALAGPIARELRRFHAAGLLE
jgi:AcrR family transcriptional regulator